jgi:DNA polymerase-4
VLTRSLTPPSLPVSEAQLADIACELRGRVGLPGHTLYRLVGVGLSGFIDADSAATQSDLFAA